MIIIIIHEFRPMSPKANTSDKRGKEQEKGLRKMGTPCHFIAVSSDNFFPKKDT